MIARIVMLGATGDLVGRYLAPAMAALRADGSLPDGFEFVGVARRDWDTDGFRDHLAEALEEHAGEVDAGFRADVVERVRYHQADSTDPDALAGAFEGDGPLVAYLALPPTIFADTLDAIATVGLPEGSRIVAEKPFGDGLESAKELNERLHRYVSEDAVHRVDHFLGMHTVQTLLGLRFANRLLEPLWSSDHLERIEILWDETLTLEDRAGYYDGTGALKDMLQNHLLQVLALLAMDPPASLSATDLRDRKAQVLRDVRRMDTDEAAASSRRARYTAGTVGDREVPSYLDEDGVDPDAETETYAELTLHIDNWRWSGVPFRLRSGKALGSDRREVVVTFREVPHLVFGPDVEVARNRLRIELDPPRLALELNVTAAAGDGLEVIELERGLDDHGLPAYAHVLRGILEGDPTLSIRDDEVVACWEIVTPVLEAWERGLVPMEEYAAGSAGPRS